ncbi:GNAT family N-acetyltransferase [Rhizobium sp. 'Codium 1']|uniref:GNAT family N-acetyltransferase n=1 Tax=Rhizobium sp. 'Codium 1' TaxID=2940484 RepID=UPI001E354996|nr:GNAT family N-acetyltransferase [Rhizobium sp. 'Codium 1']MCC8933469.1 GNAT family N-acetyltransferase [Rhizobium sp. 'Codium 1']
MDTENPPLTAGYFDVPANMLATIVTCLEMRTRPAPRPNPPSDGLMVEPWPSPATDAYRALYRRVGEDWLWVSRAVMDDDKLETIIRDPAVEIYTMTRDGERLGLLELDFREPGQCELAFFGLDQSLIGSGAGRIMMNAAIDKAWEKPISRFWVHTCHLDHPAALAFYQRSGFAPYKRMVEIFEDPRQTGKLRADAAAHFPVLQAE